MSTASLAQQIIDKIFAARHGPGLQEVTFTRDDLISAAAALGAPRPKNLGDIVYSLRYRVPLPDSIRRTAPPGREWAIFPGGNAVYTLRTVPFNLIEPRKGGELHEEHKVLSRHRRRQLSALIGAPCAVSGSPTPKCPSIHREPRLAPSWMNSLTPSRSLTRSVWV